MGAEVLTDSLVSAQCLVLCRHVLCRYTRGLPEFATSCVALKMLATDSGRLAKIDLLLSRR